LLPISPTSGHPPASAPVAVSGSIRDVGTPRDGLPVAVLDGRFGGQQVMYTDVRIVTRPDHLVVSDKHQLAPQMVEINQVGLRLELQPLGARKSLDPGIVATDDHEVPPVTGKEAVEDEGPFVAIDDQSPVRPIGFTHRPG
jgi:hypothetical protein